MRCLFCGADFLKPLTFQTVFVLDDTPSFCDTCRGRLAAIAPDACCRCCGRDLSLLESTAVKHHICQDCIWWKHSGRNGLYGTNNALFSYNPLIKEMITRFKFRGDTALAAGFACDLRCAFHRIVKKGSTWRQRLFMTDSSQFVIIPIPVSAHRLRERGFNQAEVLAELIGPPIVQGLVREKHEMKQSKKNRRQRLASRESPFQLNKECIHLLENKKILLIDDIYTTGVTMRLAAHTLIPAHPLSVDSLTLIHG
ncbi:ComF family protein [Sporolactobacillus sp. CPB3-1]|uniref:ComF family protein n=1 Tax=Sporolactobacillus mangiferae TaxID=2940498 RepID=A0ABT0MCS1_9BACL|nr:phosphoribosyltransferase family protein [Sporolactobacillus mangiferae]MCL1632658.1 ComF family protein [Sporolactobacillus mangiferae]